jgi:hypothetical protein
VAMNHVVFWEVSPCGCCSISSQLASVVVIANVVPSSQILVPLMMEAIRSSATSLLISHAT